MIIRNSVEKTVRAELSREMARSDKAGICRCPLCEADALALALTSLPPSILCLPSSQKTLGRACPRPGAPRSP